MTNTWILHIDGDGFFAYCESARFPHLRNKPVVVGVDRGIACAMTYEAKRLGITRGMPMYQIRASFPEVERLTSHFELYAQYGAKLTAIVTPHVDVFETYSIDECFCEIRFPTATTRDELHAWLTTLKESVQRQIGITYSFGLARTKVLAKIASKLQKPNGCTVIMSEDEEQILRDTPIQSIWGIGRKMYRHLSQKGILSAAHFAQQTYQWVHDLYPAPIISLWQELKGHSVFKVMPHTADPKSVQSTRSFVGTSTEITFITAELLHNLDIVCARARTYSLATCMISIFLKTKDRLYQSELVQMSHFTNNPIDIAETIAAIAKRMYISGTKYRATGVSMYGLQRVSHVQSDLFGTQAAVFTTGAIMDTVDTIRKRYGKGSISTLGTLASIHERSARSVERESSHTYISGLPYAYLGDIT